MFSDAPPLPLQPGEPMRRRAYACYVTSRHSSSQNKWSMCIHLNLLCAIYLCFASCKMRENVIFWLTAGSFLTHFRFEENSKFGCGAALKCFLSNGSSFGIFLIKVLWFSKEPRSKTHENQGKLPFGCLVMPPLPLQPGAPMWRRAYVCYVTSKTFI